MVLVQLDIFALLARAQQLKIFVLQVHTVHLAQGPQFLVKLAATPHSKAHHPAPFVPPLVIIAPLDLSQTPSTPAQQAAMATHQH